MTAARTDPLCRELVRTVRDRPFAPEPQGPDSVFVSKVSNQTDRGDSNGGSRR